MSELFLKIVNMSISAGWLILAVLAVRLLLRNAPRWINVLLWGIVALRLICPFSIESALSLIPSTQTISAQIMMDRTPEISTGIETIDRVVNPVISASFAPKPWASANPLQILIPVAANLWLLGVLVLLAYTTISYLTLRHKIRTAVILHDNIFQCETVTSPFVLGVFQPRIYLPYTMDRNNLDYVVAHEQAHIRRKDHWWKPMGFLLLTVYWFNPFVWLAYVLLCRDIELACDERVIRELGNEQRADYTQALVTCAVNRRMIAACPLAFGEVGVKDRVKSIMNYRKPAFWIMVAAVIVCAVVAVCFLTNPLDSVDYLMFTGWSDDPADFGVMTYEINLGNRAMSSEIYVEEWTKGTCVRSAPVIITQFVDSVHITVRERRDGDEKIGTEIHIDTNQYGGNLTTYFPYPEGYDGAIHFARNELNKRIKLSPGDEVILEARSYQCGNGIRPFTCKNLISTPSIMESMDYMIVIRAVFSEEPLGVTKEEPVTAPYHVLRAEILEIHDGYFIVEPVEGSWELSSASQIEVPVKNMEPSPEPQVGDILEIEYNGQLQETYPARISVVYGIRVISERPYVTEALTLNEVAELVKQQHTVSFVGMMREAVHGYWGKPDYEAYGFFGDIYHVPDTFESIVFKYDESEIVTAVEIEYRNEVPGDALFIVEIRDREKEEHLNCAEAEELFFEDDEYEYYFNVIKSHYVIVTYNDANSEDIITALNSGRATIADLDEFDIEYTKKPKS